MANEVTLNAGLNITHPSGSSSQQYSSVPRQLIDSITTVGGPTPGTVSCSTSGTTISLAALTTPGYCRIQNLDTTNFVMIGIYDGASFFPLMELGAEQFVIFKFYRGFGAEFAGTGSAAGADLMVRADTAACKVKIEAFER